MFGVRVLRNRDRECTAPNAHDRQTCWSPEKIGCAPVGGFGSRDLRPVEADCLAAS